ncbi:MAG TPA: Hpt domain-containing protein [Usitatibacter sp.]|nr:Hpt domain-containing protein [Usitatibacter sp.]
MSSAGDFEEFLARQREDYGRALPARVAGLREAWERASASRSDDDYATLQRAAHSIAGSGGTFGFPEAGTAARELETAVEARDDSAIGAALARLEETLGDGV